MPIERERDSQNYNAGRSGFGGGDTSNSEYWRGVHDRQAYDSWVSWLERQRSADQARFRSAGQTLGAAVPLTETVFRLLLVGFSVWLGFWIYGLEQNLWIAVTAGVVSAVGLDRLYRVKRAGWAIRWLIRLACVGLLLSETFRGAVSSLLASMGVW
ncbi:MAG TPA: hypothetical protein EYH07_03865 [Kiloniellaceae bacterium]|nr:hypothetical protein [Kiloniellaceae bacterium]HIP77585.1 hypothetical protein [Kiloniellaceae bacterium]